MERGTRIRNAVSGGDIIATRSASQPTHDGAERVIQLVDFASRQLADWTRVLRTASAVDTMDMTALPIDLTNGLIFIGDCGHLLVSPAHSVSDGQVTITPLIFDAAGVDVLGALAPRTAVASTLRAGPSGPYLSPVLMWETQGASVVGLHITALDGLANTITLSGGALAERPAP